MDNNTASKDLLLEMGFPLQKITQALASTGSTQIEDLITWMENNEVYESLPPTPTDVTGPESTDSAANDTPDRKSGTGAGQGGEDDPTGANPAPPNTIKVLKCKTCQKIVKTDDIATLHSAKTGHSDFEECVEEVKELSEEEKRVKITDLQNAIAKRRQEKAQQEEDEAFKKEQERRKQGKEYMSIRDQVRDQEMMKLAEERKREKLEDRMAKQRIKDLIERDKMDRAKKFSYPPSDNQQPNGGDQNGSYNNTATQPTPTPMDTNEPPREYESCDLQIRLNNGKVLKQSFGAKEELAAVRLYITINRTDDAGPNEPFNLMTSFPKKVFTEEDMTKPLSELGLVPKAVLIVTRKPAA